MNTYEVSATQPVYLPRTTTYAGGFAGGLDEAERDFEGLGNRSHRLPLEVETDDLSFKSREYVSTMTVQEEGISIGVEHLGLPPRTPCRRAQISLQQVTPVWELRYYCH